MSPAGFCLSGLPTRDNITSSADTSTRFLPHSPRGPCMSRLVFRRWLVLFAILALGSLLAGLRFSFRGSPNGDLPEPVKLAWAFEAKERGAILSSALVE